MITTRLRYCVYDPDRNGNARYYIRKAGQKKIRIRERFEDENGNITPEFMKAYWEALAAKPDKPSKALRHETFNWLVDQFYRSEAYTDLEPSTQRLRKNILNRFCDLAGELPYKKYRREDAVRSRDKRKATPAAADNLMKALRRLFGWAQEAGHVELNPIQGVKRLHKSDGWHTWTQKEIAQYREFYPLGTKPRLALEVLINVGARRSDAVRLGRQHEDNEWLKFTAFKNRKKSPVVIEVPIQSALRKALDSTETGDLTYIVTETGRSYSIDGFGNVFKDWCKSAGLPHCSAHGLRKAAAVEHAENGASASEICAIFGWSKLETAEIYVRKAQKRKMAGNAFARLSEQSKNKSVSLLAVKKASETKQGKK